MKTELQKRLALVAPSIAIVTHWEQDPYSGPVSRDCDGFTSDEDEEWQAWQSELRATAILESEEITGSGYLGGTFEKYGDNPAVSNPEISGYENHMTVEALEELRGGCRGGTAQAGRVMLEIDAALALLKHEAAESYTAQRAGIKATTV